MKTIRKNIIRIVMILIIVFTIIPSTVKASFWGDVIDSAGIFVSEGKKNSEESGTVSDEEVVETVTTLYYTLMTIGSIVAVGYGGVIGIKYMTASAEDKAKIKESMIPYVAGMAVVFGSFLIWKIAIGIFSAM